MFDIDSEFIPLTSRQNEILEYIAKGCTNGEIARFLGLSENIIKVHVTRIFSSLGVSNRTEAAFYFQELQKQQNQNLSLNSFVVIISDLKSNTLPLDEIKKIKDLIISLLSLKTFLDVVLESNLEGVQLSSRESILLRTEIEKTGPLLDINIYIDDYKNKSSIWNKALSKSYEENSEDWIAQAIVANVFRALISHINIVEPVKLSIVDNKSSCILYGLRMLDIRSFESLQNASHIFSDLLKRYPQSIFALYGLAVTEYLNLINHYTKNVEQSKINFTQCCQSLKNISQSSALSWYIQALGQIMVRDSFGAILLLKNALRLDPSLQIIYTLLGQVYCFVGDYQKGYDSMEYGFSLCPDFCYSGNNLVIMSILLYGLERYKEVIDFLEESFYLQQSSWIGMGFYVSSLYLVGDVSKAKKEAKKLKKMIEESNIVSIRNALNLLDETLRKRIENSLSKVQIVIP